MNQPPSTSAITGPQCRVSQESSGLFDLNRVSRKSGLRLKPGSPCPLTLTLSAATRGPLG